VRLRGLADILGVLQLNVCAKRFIDHFIGFLLRILFIGHGLFDTDDLIALRALAEEMTGAIHFLLWSKPRYVYQFRCCHRCLPFHPSTWRVYPSPSVPRLPVLGVLSDRDYDQDDHGNSHNDNDQIAIAQPACREIRLCLPRPRS